MLLAVDDGAVTPLEFDKAFVGISDEEIVDFASAFRMFGTVRINLATADMFLSPEVCRLHGLQETAGAIVPGELFATLHPDDAEAILEAFQTAVENRIGWYFNYRIRQPDGDYIWARVVEDFRETVDGGEFVGICYAFLPPHPMAMVVDEAEDTETAGGLARAPQHPLLRSAEPREFAFGRPVGRDHPDIQLSAETIARLISRHRYYGFFRQELDSGYCYFSKAAYSIYGLPFTEKPADLTELMRRTHPEDLALVSALFETAALGVSYFHLIHRYGEPGSERKTIRLVGKHRIGASGKAEIVGVVYEFYSNLPIVGFSG